jgi:hypothetical protein
VRSAARVVVFYSCVVFLCRVADVCVASRVTPIACSDMPPAKPLPPPAEYKSDSYYEKKQDVSGLGLEGLPAVQKKDKNLYGHMGLGGGYDEKKDRKDGASAVGASFGQKVSAAAGVDK